MHAIIDIRRLEHQAAPRRSALTGGLFALAVAAGVSFTVSPAAAATVCGRFVEDAIANKWNAEGGQAVLGCPVSDSQWLWNTNFAGVRVDLDSGMSIYWSDPFGIVPRAPQLIHGGIKGKWLGLGGTDSVLGYPTTNEIGTPDGVGRFNHFESILGQEDGSIYWTPDLGAHEIHGWIRWRWAMQGWELGTLGYPVTDTLQAVNGSFSGLENGAIYYNAATGPHAVHYDSPVFTHWQNQRWETGPLGYPVSEQDTGVAFGRFQDFENGVVAETPAIPALGVPSVTAQINPAQTMSPADVLAQLTPMLTSMMGQMKAKLTVLGIDFSWRAVPGNVTFNGSAGPYVWDGQRTWSRLLNVQLPIDVEIRNSRNASVTIYAGIGLALKEGRLEAIGSLQTYRVSATTRFPVNLFMSSGDLARRIDDNLRPLMGQIHTVFTSPVKLMTIKANANNSVSVFGG